jgi:hypothetical protein
MAAVITRNGDEIEIKVTIKLTGSMLEMEHIIQAGVNEAGILATGEALSKFDATGDQINIASIKLTSKGKVAKEYQTPYGAVMIDRHVYQTSKGGKTFCPLDERARIITSSTPKFAQMISYKYASLSAIEVADDLHSNHGRKTIPSFVQQTADMVGSIAQATEESWDYEVPVQDEPIANISLSLDGTCMLMHKLNKDDITSRATNKKQLIDDFKIKITKNTLDTVIFKVIHENIITEGCKPECLSAKTIKKIIHGEISTLDALLDNMHDPEPGGYREAMTGNISLYNPDGERVHTVYIGATPEYGKTKFLTHLQNEVDKIKKKYPDALYIGIADGATNNWDFLNPNTQCQILDFYHATEYLAGASYAFTTSEVERKTWLANTCHELKHINNAAQIILNQMLEQSKLIKDKKKISDVIKKKLSAAITYFTNQLPRMNYHEYTAKNLPIGSGITEAACKTLIKQRLCRSGMRWKNKGASIVIALRSLVKTTERWSQFWSKINQNGIIDIQVA